MSEMINSPMSLTSFHHDVEPETKTTTLEGLFHKEGSKPISVLIELTEKEFGDDLSPVLEMNKAEPVMFMLIPASVQEKLIQENEQNAQNDQGEGFDEPTVPVEVIGEDDCNA